MHDADRFEAIWIPRKSLQSIHINPPPTIAAPPVGSARASNMGELATLLQQARGRPMISVAQALFELKLVDEATFRELGADKSGKLRTYIDNRLATSENFKRELEHSRAYMVTGDMGFMDERGYFTITDRKKDMIIVSGFKVFPNQIEDAVALHPGVAEVAAVGVPDEKSGELVKIVVVKLDPMLTEQALLEHCRQHLTGYKVPKIIEFSSEPLPKTNLGKILRRQLRNRPAGVQAG